MEQWVVVPVGSNGEYWEDSRDRDPMNHRGKTQGYAYVPEEWQHTLGHEPWGSRHRCQGAGLEGAHDTQDGRVP